MYNRLFPAKIALRVISNLIITQSTTSLDLEQVQIQAAKEARSLGHELDYADKKTRKQHGEKLATGLPISSRDKATLRYQKMFVGSLDKNASGRGLLADLGLVIIKREKGRALIALTAQGAAFAGLKNPILDGKIDQSSSTLSEEETEFVIDQLKMKLPKEWERCRALIRLIGEGKETPKELDSALSRIDKGLGSSTSTERAGILSRLTEIGLVTRRREGLNVSYSLTERGKRLSREDS